MIISFKDNIDEFLKNYGDIISKNNKNNNDINSKISISKKRLSINNKNSIFERLQRDEDLKIEENKKKAKIQYPKNKTDKRKKQ